MNCNLGCSNTFGRLGYTVYIYILSHNDVNTNFHTVKLRFIGLFPQFIENDSPSEARSAEYNHDTTPKLLFYASHVAKRPSKRSAQVHTYVYTVGERGTEIFVYLPIPR